MCGQGLLLLIDLKFDHDDLTANHYYFWCSRPSDVNGIKWFDKDDKTTNLNIKIKEHCFMAWPCLLYQHLDTKNSNVCSKVIVTKTFIKPILNLSKAGSPAAHFDFSSFQ